MHPKLMRPARKRVKMDFGFSVFLFDNLKLGNRLFPKFKTNHLSRPVFNIHSERKIDFTLLLLYFSRKQSRISFVYFSVQKLLLNVFVNFLCFSHHQQARSGHIKPVNNQRLRCKHYLKSRINRILDRKSTRLNSSHVKISYAVFCLKKKNKK